MYRLDDRNRAVADMFSSIARRYDVLNRFLSLARDRCWRRRAVAETVPASGGLHLDAATGTADVALEIARRKGTAARVAAVDLSIPMMRVGLRKAARAGLAARIHFVQAPCESLPFRDASFDSASIAFGIRNVSDRQAALSEMCRVVRPGGRIVVLEFSRPPSPLFGAAYNLYFTKILPRLAGIVSRRSAYEYLPESVRAFPPPAEFAGMMRAAGCAHVWIQPLTGGIVTLYVGTR